MGALAKERGQGVGWFVWMLMPPDDIRLGARDMQQWVLVSSRNDGDVKNIAREGKSQGGRYLLHKLERGVEPWTRHWQVS